MTSDWISLFPLAELTPGTARMWRRGPDRVAVFRLDDGGLRAVDDRCPHEGFPLCQGAVSGEVLTCCFHNFKFDLSSGACLKGDERVRTYPVRVEDGQIQLDVTPPDPSGEQARRWASLAVALREDRVGQMAREVVRLIDLGVPPIAIARVAAAFDGAHAEYGTTHALPVSIDALTIAPPGLEAARSLVVALELASRGSVRRTPHPPATPVDPGPAEGFTEALRSCVEAEDGDGAQALLAGALGAGWGRPVLEPAFLRLASDHFLDYGHALIYANKVWAILDGAPPEQVAAVLSGLLRSIVDGTREDTLPSWAGWRRRCAEVAMDLPRWRAQDAAVEDPDALEAAVLDGGVRVALDAVIVSLAGGAGPTAIAEVLARAATERFLRFDPQVDLDLDLQDNWLSVTHVQSFCHGVRHALRTSDHPDLVRLILQATRMIAMTAPLDTPEAATWSTGIGGGDSVIAAIAARDPDAAVEAVLGTADLRDLWSPLRDLILDDPVVRPIFMAHAIKQLVVAFDDAEYLDSLRPVAALARFLAAPRQERRVAQRIHEAIALVRDGAVPRRRVP